MELSPPAGTSRGSGIWGQARARLRARARKHRGHDVAVIQSEENILVVQKRQGTLDSTYLYFIASVRGMSSTKDIDTWS